MLKPATTPTPTLNNFLSKAESQSTLVSNHPYYGDLDVVVFGQTGRYVAALMAGLIPAIEAEPAPSVEAAMRKLMSSTAEMLHTFIPKIGSHQRNIHGGGVFNESLLSPELLEAQKNS